MVSPAVRPVHGGGGVEMVKRAGLAASLALLLGACTLLRLERDYVVIVGGVVLDDSGDPVAGARATLAFLYPTVTACAPSNWSETLTSETGGFMFRFSSRKGLRYAVTVRKDGFHGHTIEGRAPPSTTHTIRIKRLR
jgi:hypothetical protein